MQSELRMGKSWKIDAVGLSLALLSLALFMYAYHETFLWLYERYTNPNSHYSHGFLIPLVSGYLIWQKRNHLRELIRPGSKIGLILIGMACLVHIGSVWTHIFFLSGFSILLFAIGLSLYLCGVEVTRKIAFPLGFLLFMFPLPMRAVDAVSFPLKLMVANISSGIIGYAGIPILREGSIIHLAKTSMTIGDPCSGIRSLISLLALGALIAHLAGSGVMKKMVIFLSSIPIAILTNVIRVCLLILAANWLGGEWASPDHWFHTASGMGVFVISMILLLLTARLLE